MAHDIVFKAVYDYYEKDHTIEYPFKKLDNFDQTQEYEFAQKAIFDVIYDLRKDTTKTVSPDLLAYFKGIFFPQENPDELTLNKLYTPLPNSTDISFDDNAFKTAQALRRQYYVEKFDNLDEAAGSVYDIMVKLNSSNYTKIADDITRKLQRFDTLDRVNIFLNEILRERGYRTTSNRKPYGKGGNRTNTNSPSHDPVVNGSKSEQFSEEEGKTGDEAPTRKIGVDPPEQPTSEDWKDFNKRFAASVSETPINGTEKLKVRNPDDSFKPFKL